MKTRALMLLFLLCSISLISAIVTVFDETWNVTTPPTGWAVQGYVGTSHTSTGTAKTNTDFFKNAGGGGSYYLRLTENAGYNRAWAYFTDQKFRIMGQWKVTMEVRIGKTHDGSEVINGADGLCLIFPDAATCETNGALDLAKVQGGYGEFEGTPRGAKPNQPVNSSKGYRAGFKGYSLEFDHYNNAGEVFREYIHWVDLGKWEHSFLGMDMSATTSFYYNDGWVKCQVEANYGVITFRYNWNGSTYSNSTTIDANNPTNPLCDPIYNYITYLGIGAATGGETAFHEIRNMKLEAEETTLPVELSSFTATQTSANLAQINWTTQSETGVVGYKVHRNDAANLDSAILVSPLIQAANTSQVHNYSFTDQEVAVGETWYYWLENQEINGASDFHGPISITLSANSVTPPPVILPKTGLKSIYPNPFNPQTIISYDLVNEGMVTIDVFNIKGEKVRNLYSGNQGTGTWNVSWDGTADNGQNCTSGIYYVKMTAGKNSSMKKAIMLK